MRNFKKLLFFLFALCVITIPNTVVHADDDDVKPKKVTKIIASRKNIRVGNEFELKAKVTPTDADDDYLKWTIIGKKGIIKFDDDDRNDDEAEFKAIKAGTTKVRCSIKGKSKKYSKTFTVTVKKPTYNFSRVGKKNVKVEVGDDFELKVKKSSDLKNKHLKWSIKNVKIVDFDDADRYGDEIELDAKKIGKTTVTCKNLKTKKTIKFTIQVIADTDDDSDDDDDDD